jgi:CO/xanthine dehydrogenase FAD-binding subunit
MIIDLRFAFGAVNTTVVRRAEIECQYIKKTIEELKASIDEIIDAYAPYIKPIDDQRSNKEYRTTVSKNLLRGFIEEL